MFKLFNDKQILNESEGTSVAQKSAYSLCPYGSAILPLFPPKVAKSTKLKLEKKTAAIHKNIINILFIR